MSKISKFDSNMRLTSDNLTLKYVNVMKTSAKIYDLVEN